MGLLKGTARIWPLVSERLHGSVITGITLCYFSTIHSEFQHLLMYEKL